MTIFTRMSDNVHGLPCSGDFSEDSHRHMQSGKGETLFTADWDRVLMLHYAVSPDTLQPYVPFELDTFHGMAYVSLVAFTMRGMCPIRGGPIAKLAFVPIASHEFLNIRAYVKHERERGIYFLAEWLPNPLSVVLGRPLFGLPYRLGKFDYQHSHEQGEIHGIVKAGKKGSLSYRASVNGDFSTGLPGSLDTFLLERYAAFTFCLGWKRRFRVWHKPWLYCKVEPTLLEDNLSHFTGNWIQKAKIVDAHYSPGATEVWMGRPRTV